MNTKGCNLAQSNDRLAILDVIKGVCIFFIIITHYNWTESQTKWGLWPFIIDMAVPMFMMISGYVNANSYVKKGITQFEDAYVLANILKKVTRYTIPFTVAWFIENILYIVLGELDSAFIPVALFLTGGVGPGSYYYPIMIQFIFVFPIIFFTMRNNPRGGLLGWFLFNAFYEIMKVLLEVNAGEYRLTIFRYTFLIACGCFSYLNSDEIPKKYSIMSFIVGVVFIICTRYLEIRTVVIDMWTGTSFMSALYIAPIFYFLIKKYGKATCKPLEYIGKAAFDIFLVQMLYYEFATGMVYSISNNTAIRVIANILICIVFGLIFYKLESRITNGIIKKI